MSPTEGVAAGKVLQIRVELLDVEPAIWRRIQIPVDATFWGLHIAIQGAMGWNDSHLHEFEVPRPAGVVVPHLRTGAIIRFGIPTADQNLRAPEDRPLPGWDFQVAAFTAPGHQPLHYCYDFGDDWRHLVEVEAIFDAMPGKRYPRCIAGERAGPPDDCGGVPGYQELLEVLADTDHEEFASMGRWASRAKRVRVFDPEAFDEQRVKFANPGIRLKRLLKASRLTRLNQPSEE